MGSADFTGTAVEEMSGADTGTASDVGAGAISAAGAGSDVSCTGGVDTSLEETAAGGSGVGSAAEMEGPDSFDGPVGSAIDSAASRAGDSATGLGITCSGPGALASSLRDSVDDREGVPGLAKPPTALRAVDDLFIIVPMRDRSDFVLGDPWG